MFFMPPPIHWTGPEALFFGCLSSVHVYRHMFACACHRHLVVFITLPQVHNVNFRLLQSSKIAASEFFNRAAASNEAEETNATENDADENGGDEDEDEDGKVERNVDYEGDYDDKAELSDSVESGW